MGQAGQNVVARRFRFGFFLLELLLNCALLAVRATVKTASKFLFGVIFRRYLQDFRVCQTVIEVQRVAAPSVVIITR